MKTDEELKIFFNANKLGKVDVIKFSPENCWAARIFLINKDFKINSSVIPIFSYFIKLKDKNTLDLKQFKIEISE